MLGTFAWLTFITGARRGELVALAWEHVDLISGLLTIRRNLVRRNSTTILKDTKTHQMRVIKLDHDTVVILTAHQQRAQVRCAELGTTLDDDAFVFSYAPDHRRHCDPDGITHRYAKMTGDLGIDRHLHALRHYSATELLAGGVDLRTVAGVSVTAAAEPPRSRSMPRGSPVPTPKPPTSSPPASPGHPTVCLIANRGREGISGRAIRGMEPASRREPSVKGRLLRPAAGWRSGVLSRHQAAGVLSLASVFPAVEDADVARSWRR